MFYNYIYLDPRKPGKDFYDGLDICFLYEPFYVGKGKKQRMYDHLKNDNRNEFRKNKIRKILSSGFDIKKYVFKFNETLNEELAYDNENNIICRIGRLISDDGPLVNFSSGGRGSDSMYFHPNRNEIIEKTKRIGEEHWAFNKTYEELYGINAIEEKNKRQKSFFKEGRIVSEEVKKKCSDSLKGKIPWNKDKKGSQIAWNKGRKIASNKYSLINLITNEIFMAEGYTELDEIIRKINKGKPHKERVKKVELLKKEFRNYKLKIEKNERDKNL